MSKKIRNIFRRNNTSSTKLDTNDFSKDITEHMLDLIAISDKNGVLVYASPSHKRLGYKPQDIIGHSILEFVHDDDYTTSKEGFGHFVKGTYNTVAPFRFQSADGTYIWHETVARPIKNDRILFCSRDISKRKDAEHKLFIKHKENIVLRNTQRAMIDNNKDVIVIIDENKLVKFISANVENLFGWKSSEILNRNFCHIIPTDDQAVCQQKLEQCLVDNNKYTFESEIITKDGHLCAIELNCKNFLKYKPIAGLLINISDISERKRAELEIHENKERYKALHDASFGGIAMHDQGAIIDCNLGLEKISGYTRKELIGKDGLHLIADSFRDTVKTNIISGYEDHYEVKGIRKNGDLYDLRLHGKNIPYKGREIRVVEFRDISERKEIERKLNEQQRLFKTMFHTIKEGIIITDTDGIIIMANDSINTIFGYDPELLINQTIKNLFPNSTAYENIIEQCFNEKDSYTQTTYKHYDGHTFEGEIFGTKLFDNSGTWIGNIAVSRDITENIKALEDLQQAKNQAEESSRLKTEFINNMSHEIRTPMNGIIGFSEMLSSANLSEERRNYFIKIIQNSSEQLLRIIDDILEISILETNKLKVNNTDVCLNGILDNIYASFDNIANKHKVPLRLNKTLNDEESTFTSDESKLKKTITNLLSNAIKYTDEGYIEIGYHQKGQTIEIYVKDTGSGIAPENHKLIFQRFAQAEKEVSQKRGGLGLGLSIAQANAHLLEGNITVESALDNGATFTLSLPFKSAAAKKKEEQENAQGLHSDKFTILVAEDEDVNYLYLEAVMDAQYKDKYIILHAHDGEEAIDIALEKDDIDLVLMDIKMPKINGLEATQRIKAVKPNLTIIAQTAYTTEQDINKARQHGCDDFISKPINRNDLIQLINKYINVNL